MINLLNILNKLTTWLSGKENNMNKIENEMELENNSCNVDDNSIDNASNYVSNIIDMYVISSVGSKEKFTQISNDFHRYVMDNTDLVPMSFIGGPGDVGDSQDLFLITIRPDGEVDIMEIMTHPIEDYVFGQATIKVGKTNDLAVT